MAMAALAVGAGIAAYASYKEGQAAREEGRTQDRWHQYNAKVEEANAAQAKANADYEGDIHRDESRRRIASIKTAYSHAGINMSGTSLDVLADSVANASMEQSMISRQGYNDEQMFKSKATLERGYGSMARVRGNNAYQTGRLKAWSQGVTAVGFGASSASTHTETGKWG